MARSARYRAIRARRRPLRALPALPAQMRDDVQRLLAHDGASFVCDAGRDQPAQAAIPSCCRAYASIVMRAGTLAVGLTSTVLPSRGPAKTLLTNTQWLFVSTIARYRTSLLSFDTAGNMPIVMHRARDAIVP